MSKSLYRGMPKSWEDFPPRKNADGKWLCKKCGIELDGRKTAWCGKDCLNAVLLLVHWPRIRRVALRRDKYRCRLCGNRGNEVDHIIEIVDGGLSVLENLRTLCHECHKKKTTAERHRRSMAKKLTLAAEEAKPYDQDHQGQHCQPRSPSQHISPPASSSKPCESAPVPYNPHIGAFHKFLYNPSSDSRRSASLPAVPA